MTELRFTRKAVEDLSDIWRYTVERWSEEQADRYYGLLVATCRKIAASTVPIYPFLRTEDLQRYAAERGDNFHDVCDPLPGGRLRH